MSQQLKELEASLFSDADDSKSSAQVTYDQYVAGLEKKTDRSMRTGNMLETKKQAQISRLGGGLLEEADTTKGPFTVFADKLKKWLLPASITMLCGTFTYPIAVRIARKVFRLRGFYSIHFAIAPFLALIHVNIFGTLHAYFRLKIAERDFELYFGKATNNIAMKQFM